MNLTTAVTVFFKKAVREGGIPFPVSTDPDGEWFPGVREEPVFQDGAGREVPVHCKWVNAHGAEVFSAMQLQLRQNGPSAALSFASTLTAPPPSAAP